MITDNIMICN